MEEVLALFKEGVTRVKAAEETDDSVELLFNCIGTHTPNAGLEHVVKPCRHMVRGQF